MKRMMPGDENASNLKKEETSMGIFSLDSPGAIVSGTDNRLNKKYEVIVNCNKEETKKKKNLDKPRASIEFAAFENINVDMIDELFTKKSINRIS